MDREIENDVDFCSDCGRVVRDGEEHDPESHLSTREHAEELAAWKRSFKEATEPVPVIDCGTF